MSAELKLWQPEAFIQYRDKSYFNFGAYFSLILIVLLANLVNWLISRRILFIVYVVYLALNAIQWLGINGFTGVFIFPQSPLLANLSLGLALSLAAGMALVFFTLLFELKRYHPYIYRFNLFGVAVALITAVGTPFGYYQSLAAWLLLIASASLLLAFWPLKRLWMSENLWNRVMVIGYGAFSVLILINILSSIAAIEFSETTIFAGMMANLFHMLVIHLAVMRTYMVDQRYLAELKVTRDKLEHLSVTDPLTGLANRRRFEEAISAECHRARRSGKPVSVIMIDIDYFKKFNDTYGHQAGDDCLKSVAEVIRKNLKRTEDLAARYGGEEFICILPDTEQQAAIAIAEGIRHGVEGLVIPHGRSKVSEYVTASLGVDTRICDGETPSFELIRDADKRLYEAKENGRNQVAY